jgi:hypothetical protein
MARRVAIKRLADADHRFNVRRMRVLFPYDVGPVSIRTAQYWSETIRFKAFTSHTHLITLGFDDVAPEIMRQSTTETDEPMLVGWL